MLPGRRSSSSSTTKSLPKKPSRSPSPRTTASNPATSPHETRCRSWARSPASMRESCSSSSWAASTSRRSGARNPSTRVAFSLMVAFTLRPPSGCFSAEKPPRTQLRHSQP
ncbi:hypothetical protein CMUS01_05944 [Colletotrichum musicola]|uniref:Uncharacterized protein n=1 Tax=Colletotrichum musicola TaxID=2175873 RepID=A0A8H6KP05_9PEZI|nr:hypothetical protein CMUS01_05944 [Colletotrichum musicola]